MKKNLLLAISCLLSLNANALIVSVEGHGEIDEKGMALYRQMEKDYLLPFADGDIDAANAAVLTGKLAQMAGEAARIAAKYREQQ